MPENHSIIGQRLRACRERADETLEEIGALVGVNRSTVLRWEKGDTARINLPTLERLADHFSVSPSWLIGKSNDEKDGLSSPSPTVPFGAVPADLHCVAPVLGTVRAGQPIYAQENIEEYLPISFRDGAKYFFLHICGDSMSAAGMDDGDLILVRSQPEVEDGQLAVVCVNGDEATVKYYRREGDLVVLTPKSFNAEHQTQIYSLKDVPVHICGLVVQIIKTVG